MGCDCDKYINCNDASVAYSSSALDAFYGHKIDRTIEVTNLPITFIEKTKRTFNISWGNSGSYKPTHLVACETTTIPCSPSGASSARANVSEDCVREVNQMYYMDRLNEIYVYKYTKESLKFDVDSGGKTADFKTRYGYGPYHKLCIKDSVKTVGEEKFVLVKGGVETILATKAYEYNPFPEADIKGGTWGLYGGVIQRDAEPETPNVVCILITPTVPKLAIPNDADVKHYGFYDYNAIDGGFTENSLSKDDGGKDYFYPYWCRQMELDALWRATADSRYQAIYDSRINISGESKYTQQDARSYALPFGSFAVDDLDNFIYSCLCKFSDRAGGSGAIVNYSSFGDLHKAIYTDNKITARSFNDFFPVSPL